MNKFIRILIYALVAVFFAVLLLFGIFWFICDENNKISRYSVSCYLCIKAPIRNFPLMGIVGEPVFNSKHSVSGAGGLFSESVMFETSESPEKIKILSENYFLSIGYKKISESQDNNSLSISQIENGFIYRNNEQTSFILIGISNSKNQNIQHVYVVEEF